MKNVLAFFGAFNPPTIAHIRLGHIAMQQTEREGVLYVPSKSVYIESDQGKSFAFGDQERLNMLRAVAAQNPWMEVSDRELTLDRQPRTYETLCWLSGEGYRPSLLMGSDKLPELQHGWKYVEEIVFEFGIVCMCRGGDDARSMIREDPYLNRLSSGITVLEMPKEFQMISSSEVRDLLQQLQMLQKEPDAADAMEELYRKINEKVPPEAAAQIFGIPQ